MPGELLVLIWCLLIDANEIDAKNVFNKGVLILTKLIAREKNVKSSLLSKNFNAFVPLTDYELRYTTWLIISLYIDTTRSLLHH